MTTKKRALRPSRAKPVASKPAAKADKAPKLARTAAKAAKGTGSATPRTKRPTRGDEVVEMLQRKGGATISAMVTRFGLLPHSLRAIISIEGRKRGLKVELVGKAHYRIR